MEQDWRKFNYHDLIEDGIKATRIQYPYGGGFFTPKLKGINHVTLGDSKMIHNPFVILLEWLYVKYKDCLLYTSPSPRDATLSRMPSSA